MKMLVYPSTAAMWVGVIPLSPSSNNDWCFRYHFIRHSVTSFSRSDPFWILPTRSIHVLPSCLGWYFKLSFRVGQNAWSLQILAPQLFFERFIYEMITVWISDHFFKISLFLSEVEVEKRHLNFALPPLLGPGRPYAPKYTKMAPLDSIEGVGPQTPNLL